MGVIQRQSIKNSIVNYAAVGIGALSTVLVYPLIEQSQLGMIQFSVNTAAMFIPFAQFGLSLSAVRFFNQFRNEKNGHNGFIFLWMAAISTSLFVVCSCIFGFRAQIAGWFGENGGRFLETLPFMLGVLIFSTYSNFLTSHAANFNRIVVPSMLNNLVTKIAQPLLVLGIFFGFLQISDALLGMSITFLLIFLGLIFYLHYLGEWHFQPNFAFYDRDLLYQIFNYSSFNTLVTASSAFALQLDRLFVPAAIGFGALAVFNVGALIAEAIDVPRKALAGIAAPLVAKSLHENNLEHVNEIYQRSALMQTVAGVFLLGGVWLCADSLFDLMPKNQDAFRAGKYVILWLGMARVLDMMTGINAEIITYSNYFRFNMLSMLAMAALNIGLNIVFFKYFQLGVLSPAVATFLAILFINAWRLVFIYQKFGFQPLQMAMFWTVIFGLLSYGATWFLMSMWTQNLGNFHPILQIILGGGIFSVIFGISIIRSEFVPDLNEAIRTVKRRYFKF